MAKVTRPKIVDTRPSELVDWARDGRIRLPSFQRSYQWESSDVRRLFDSLLRGYPIGNLLVWERPASAEDVTIGHLTVTAADTHSAYWVVDGQQRITSLVGALTATGDTVDPRFRVYYDLDSGDFATLPRRRKPSPDWFPVPLTLDTARANAWIRERPHLTGEQIAQADELIAAVRDYRIPMYIVSGDDERALREIFDRMNTYGKALKSADVFRALHASSDAREPGDLTSLSAEVEAHGFGRFTDQLLMQSILAIRGPVLDRDFRKEFADAEDLKHALSSTRDALGHVVDFLRDEAGIPHIKLLPYALFVPVLARFVAAFGPPRGRSERLLRRWIWRGSVLGVAPQGNTVGLRKNAQAVRDDPTASAERLIGLLPAGAAATWVPDLSHTRINSALGKVNILGLLSRAPRPLPSAGTLMRTEAEERPIDISAVLELDAPPPLLAPVFDLAWPEGENIANRLVAPGAKAAQVHAALLDGEVDDRFLTGQCLDAACLKFLRSGDSHGFLAHRGELARSVIAAHVQEYALFGFRDGPTLSTMFEDTPLPVDSDRGDRA
ncbi:uncharacterized protein DUF262 [Murinocardiopsis flavida]|uniref:Uncharacterized protein DUF262 n=1 Tax=Murinocardiopsis flavida TaxID=645275 RepID=A0A2P8DP65_9ACTN|nr:DUF262 domain-containing protein [Murinocardiopsis flavida]PSK99014.1 uncharacterized protein DUF262 [Murinocardiopsis flavida]